MTKAAWLAVPAGLAIPAWLALRPGVTIAAGLAIPAWLAVFPGLAIPAWLALCPGVAKAAGLAIPAWLAVFPGLAIPAWLAVPAGLTVTTRRQRVSHRRGGLAIAAIGWQRHRAAAVRPRARIGIGQAGLVDLWLICGLRNFRRRRNPCVLSNCLVAVAPDSWVLRTLDIVLRRLDAVVR